VGTRLKCRVGGKRERIDGTKDTLIWNCGGKKGWESKWRGAEMVMVDCGKKDGTLSKGKKK